MRAAGFFRTVRAHVMKADLEFLALLVHKGHVPREHADALLAGMKAGATLDTLLEERLGFSAEHVAKLRRTRAGSIPEIPGYEILGELGHGGTADVFHARDKRSGDELALKVLKPECAANPATLAAFVREARLLEKLDHPGLVKGKGIARFGSVYFSKLEHLDGKTLLELLDDGAFGEDDALRVVLAVAEVLQYMASQGLVHRDVKPGNVMTTHEGSLKLIDLGFAASTSERTNAEGTATGTAAYLSPEQARGGAAADLRSDVYSLGVTLFHLVVGRLPFQSSNDADVLRMQVMQSLSSPELKGRGLSPHVHYFIEKMMSKDAELRYQSFEELIADVRGQIEGRERLDYDRAAPPAKKTPPPRRRRF